MGERRGNKKEESEIKTEEEEEEERKRTGTGGQLRASEKGPPGRGMESVVVNLPKIDSQPIS